MQQMNIPEEMRVKIDPDTALPHAFKVLDPIVFKEEDSYCCLLGPDPQAGIFGCGDSVNAAIQDWNDHVKDVIEQKDQNDEMFAYVKDKLNASTYKIN